MGKVFHWELCKVLKFDHTTKWYMHKSESVLENETWVFWGFWDTIPVWSNPKKMITHRLADFAVPGGPQRKKMKVNEKRDMCEDLSWQPKK